MANLPKTVISCKNASRAEVQVLAEFLNRSGFVNNDDKASNFQVSWIFEETLLHNTFVKSSRNLHKNKFTLLQVE
jgi:hypothetical protein